MVQIDLIVSIADNIASRLVRGLLESGTFGDEDKFVTEITLTTIEVELETGDGGLLLDGTDSLSTDAGDDVRFEDFTFSEEKILTGGDNLVLDGTDSSSTDAGSKFISDSPEGKHKLVPENFEAGEENHLVLETSPDSVVDNHYHLPRDEPHVDGDGHTEEEHRELSLWPHRLDILMARERSNALL